MGDTRVIEVRDNRVFIKKKQCLRCTHLVGDLGSKEYSCYDIQCPATGLKIVLGVNLDAVAKSLADAYNNNNMKKISKITERLSKYDTRVIEEVMKRVKVLRR